MLLVVDWNVALVFSSCVFLLLCWFDVVLVGDLERFRDFLIAPVFCVVGAGAWLFTTVSTAAVSFD